MKTGTSCAALAAILCVSTAAAADISGWCRYALSDAPKSAPNEDPMRDGLSYYNWTGSKIEKLAFMPAIWLCHRSRD